MASLPTLSELQLRRACGGVRMQITQYGYPGDPYSDSETRAGHGAYRNLSKDSVALTDSGLALLGLTKSYVRRHPEWVDIKTQGGGILHRRIDDRAPEHNARADLYMPRGFDRRIRDYGDVTLSA